MFPQNLFFDSQKPRNLPVAGFLLCLFFLVKIKRVFVHFLLLFGWPVLPGGHSAWQQRLFLSIFGLRQPCHTAFYRRR